MSVYAHQQGTYTSIRVARSVNGKLRQKYFPRSEEGWKAARELDRQWEEEQARAQLGFKGLQSRWRRREPLSAPRHETDESNRTTRE